MKNMKKEKCYALDFFAKNPRAFARIHFLTMYGLDALIAHTQHTQQTQHTDNDKKPVLLHVLQQLNESLWEYMLFVDCKQSRYSELRSIKEMRSGNWEKYVTAHIIYAIREYILHNTPINIDFDLGLGSHRTRDASATISGYQGGFYYALHGDSHRTAGISVLSKDKFNYKALDGTSIPTGEILKVAGTPFDFRKPKKVGQEIDADHEQIKHGAGYDHCFVLNKKEEGELSFAARIKEPNSGRTMEVYTTEPGVQVYTHNWADGYKGQHGATFPRRSAICFEAQHFPDSPNHPYFPSVILEPCKEYTQKTIYKFGVEK